MIAALFPGQNSQVVGMASELYRNAAAKAVLDRAEAALPGLLELMWRGPEDKLKLTANQQPALVAAGAAAFAAYREAGGEAPAYLAGHSLGEFTAHVVAGSLALEDAVQLVHKRGRYMQEAVPSGRGAMAAILKTGRTHVERVCAETAAETGQVVDVANLNAPEQTVISGDAGAVEAAAERLKGEGARTVMLSVSAPFHCSLMRPAAEKLAHDLQAVTFSPPQTPIVCNVTAAVLDNIADAPSLLEQQVTAPVRWVETLERLQALGVTEFLEFGSGNVLSGLVKRTLKGIPALAITDMKSLEEAL